MKNDSIKTLIIAAILCIVCSVMVSGAAVLLKPRQDVNKDLDVKKNLLLASGLIKLPTTPAEIDEAFSKIKTEIIDLETGEVAQGIDPNTFDQAKASKAPDTSKAIEASNDIAGIKSRSKYAPVYQYIKDDKVEMIVLPVYGKGLWSTMYGFLALSADTKTIKGLGFYAHGETPGLGGEVDNPRWKAQWPGKKLYDDDLNIKFHVAKGSVNPSSPNAEYQVDGLSGATITANGVTSLVRYWTGADGFGPYLANVRQSSADLNANEEGMEE